MEVIFESNAAVVRLDERGFVECIVSEGHEIDLNDARQIHDAIEAHGEKELRLLINRIHSYSTAQSLLLLHSREDPAALFRIRPKKVACVVYQPMTGMIADFVGGLVFKKPPYEVFLDRERAIEWLMTD